jgi:hypothetical protein
MIWQLVFAGLSFVAELKTLPQMMALQSPRRGV